MRTHRRKAQGLFRQTLSTLRKKLPLEYTCSVKRCPMPDSNDFGSCDFNPETEHFTIRIESGLDEVLQSYILIHEYAHCLSFSVPNTGDHGPHFGVAYAQCYRAWLGEDEFTAKSNT